MCQKWAGGVDAFDLVESQQHDTHGESLPLEMPQRHGHLGRDVRKHRDDRRVAREPRLGLDQELVEGQAVGQLDTGQDLANSRKTLGAATGRNNERTEPVVASRVATI